MGTSGRTERPVVESTQGNGAPEEIRTLDPQIRSLVPDPADVFEPAFAKKHLDSGRS
jgi:hypothetical protein